MSTHSLQIIVILMGAFQALIALTVFLFDPRRTTNVALAIYLLVFAAYSAGVAGMADAVTVEQAAPWTWVVALVGLQVSVGLIYLTLHVFRFSWLRRPHISLPLAVASAAPVILVLIDGLFQTRLMYPGLDARLYLGGYVELSAFLNTPLSVLFRVTNLYLAQVVQIGLVVHLLRQPDTRPYRSALWVLLMLEALGALSQMVLRALIGPLAAFILIQFSLTASVALVFSQTHAISTRKSNRLLQRLGFSGRRAISVRVKLLALAAIVITIMTAGQGAINIESINQQSERNDQLRLLQQHNDYRALVSNLEQTAGSLATSLADRVDIAALFKARDRDVLLARLTPLFTTLKEQYNVVHMYVEDADGRVFLRVHDPDVYGDDITYRRTAAQALATQQTVSGLDIGPNRLGVRGVSPLYDNNQFIGLVEVGLDYDQRFINSLKNRSGSDFRLWVTHEAAAPANLRPSADAPAAPLDSLFFYAATTQAVPTPPAEVFRRVMSTGKAEYQQVNTADQSWAVMVVPLQAYPDRIIGAIEIILSRAAFVADFQQIRFTNLTLAAGLGLLAFVLLWISTTNAVLNPLLHLTTIAGRQLRGDLKARAEIESRDEFRQLGDTLNSLTAQLSDLIGSLEQRVLARTEQLRASAEVGHAAASILDGNELLTTIVNLIAQRFGFYYVAIFTVSPDNQYAVLHDATGEAGRVLKEQHHRLKLDDQSMVGNAIRQRRLQITSDVTQEAAHSTNPLLPETRSEIALPLMVGDRILGALDVQSVQPNAFDEGTATVLQSMADQIAVALSNAEQFKQTQAALEQASALYNASQSITLAEEPQMMLTELIKYAAADADGATIILHERAQSGSAEPRLEAVATWARQASDKQVAPGTHFTMEQLPIMRSLSPDQPIIIEDANAPDVDAGLRRAMNLLNVRAAVVLPMVTGQHPFGALIIAYREPRLLPLDNLRPLIALTNQLAVSVQNQQLLAETHLTLEQLNEANRRLTGEAWRAYTRAAARPLRVIDAGPGVVPEQLPPTAEAAVPIVVRGEAIGHLKLRDTDRRASWSEADLALLQAVAAEVAGVIDNARLFEQARDRAAREAQFNRIADRIRRASGIQAILRAAAEELSVALDTSHAHAQLSRAVGQADGREPTGER